MTTRAALDEWLAATAWVEVSDSDVGVGAMRCLPLVDGRPTDPEVLAEEERRQEVADAWAEAFRNWRPDMFGPTAHPPI